MHRTAIQDQITDNLCWGCGPDNPDGLHLKSYWADGVTTAEWTPWPMFAAGPPHFLNGGIIATLLDCHGVCTAIDDSYRRQGRTIGTEPRIWHATTSMSVDYMRPVAIANPVTITGRVIDIEGRITVVECVLASDDKDRARAIVRSVEVPSEWGHGRTS